jgi:hypothetical protein
VKRSQNNWPVLGPEQVRRWAVPLSRSRSLILPAAPGAPGFILTHLALWFHEEIEPLGAVADDWGYAVRKIKGSTITSNHSSGTAIDVNATAHPAGVATHKTFTDAQIMRIHARLNWYDSLVNQTVTRRQRELGMGGVIRWGGDYVNVPDAMHFELDEGRTLARLLAKQLEGTPRGKRVREENPVLTMKGKEI